MSDVITKCGDYMHRHSTDRLKARVVHIEDGYAFGFDSDGDPDSWRCSDGRSSCTRDITGPWIPEPPTPPEGFELKPKDYVAKEGDRCVWGRATSWHDVSGWKGFCAQELEDEFSARIPVYIASPIPKPAKPDPGEGWRLLEEGETVECDDENRDVKFKEEWSLDRGAFAGKNVGQKMRQYERNGLHFRRRLPDTKPEWTCVGDLRWRRPATGWASMTPDVAQILNTLEQRWTNGTDSEWRPVPATNE